MTDTDYKSTMTHMSKREQLVHYSRALYLMLLPFDTDIIQYKQLGQLRKRVVCREYWSALGDLDKFEKELSALSKIERDEELPKEICILFKHLRILEIENLDLFSKRVNEALPILYAMTRS